MFGWGSILFVGCGIFQQTVLQDIKIIPRNGLETQCCLLVAEIYLDYSKKT